MNNINLFIEDPEALKNIKNPIRVIGIDLGTTNSAVAEIIFNPGDEEIKAQCLPISQKTESGTTSLKMVPSVLAMKNNDIFVGEGAKRMIPKIADKYFIKDFNIFYECKNDIGTRKIYQKAPDGFKTPAEISGKILEFIFGTVKDYSDLPISKTVVTVPASFHISQRNDTITAAGLGGIFTIDKGDLLDEPIAAFLYYIFGEDTEIQDSIKTPKNILLFDFGGGTCDVSILNIKKEKNSNRLDMKYGSVSRYHRLGGGDIDRAIVYDILIPKLMEENQLRKNELTYEIKKLLLEAGLTGIAESLKIGISNEIQRKKNFGIYENPSQIEKIIPTQFNYKIGTKNCTLTNPKITASEFEKILNDFFSEEFLFPRESEYKLTNSIFSPIQDALDRANLEKSDIHYVLLTGGSSCIPFVGEKIEEYFQNAKIIRFDDDEKYHTSIAMGAAYFSFYKALNGKSIINKINHFNISINTQEGFKVLIPEKVELPYPSDNSYLKNYDFVVPHSDDVPFNITIEIYDSDSETLLLKKYWAIEDKNHIGDKIILNYRMNSNGIIEMYFTLLGSNSETFELTVENPLMNVVKPDTRRIRIEEIEYMLKSEKISENSKYDRFKELASLYSDIGQYEKAIDLYVRILNHFQGNDSSIFNKLAELYERIGNYDKMEAVYLEGFKKFRWAGFLFNLALKQNFIKDYQKASVNIEEAVSRENSAPYFVLKAKIFQNAGNEEEAKESLDEAYSLFGDIQTMDDWELGWYITFCNMRDDKENLKQANLERKLRSSLNSDGNTPDNFKEEKGILPTTK